MKQLTKDVVQEIAELQMVSGGWTTTLGVKTELRNMDYWAVQADVSRLMGELAEDGVFEMNLDPDWALYSSIPYHLFSPAPDTDEDNDVQATLDDSYSVVVLTQPEPDCWLLFAYTNTANKPRVYVEGNVDRNAARAWYEREYGVNYAMVGCSKRAR